MQSPIRGWRWGSPGKFPCAERHTQRGAPCAGPRSRSTRTVARSYKQQWDYPTPRPSRCPRPIANRGIDKHVHFLRPDHVFRRQVPLSAGKLPKNSITQAAWDPLSAGWGAGLQHEYTRRLDVLPRGFGGTTRLVHAILTIKAITLVKIDVRLHVSL